MNCRTEFSKVLCIRESFNTNSKGEIMYSKTGFKRSS